jgi:prepilin-type N-terminal cleavage/methylation domain-containing protein
MHSCKKGQLGFTLIELVAVIVILAILAAIAIPKFLDMQTEAKDARAKAVAGAISSWSAMNFAAYLANGETTTNIAPDPYAWPFIGSRECSNNQILLRAFGNTTTQSAAMTFSGTIAGSSCPAGSSAVCYVAHSDTLNFQPYEFVCATY